MLTMVAMAMGDKRWWKGSKEVLMKIFIITYIGFCCIQFKERWLCTISIFSTVRAPVSIIMNGIEGLTVTCPSMRYKICCYKKILLVATIYPFKITNSWKIQLFLIRRTQIVTVKCTILAPLHQKSINAKNYSQTGRSVPCNFSTMRSILKCTFANCLRKLQQKLASTITLTFW